MSSHFSGIECPSCGSIDLRVLETRRTPQAIVRRRVCDRRHRFSTIEMVAPAKEVSLAVFALERAIKSQQEAVDAARDANPSDHYLGVAQLEDIELLKQALEFVQSVGLPEEAPEVVGTA